MDGPTGKQPADPTGPDGNRKPRKAAPMPVARLVTPGPSVAVTTAGRRAARAKP